MAEVKGFGDRRYKKTWIKALARFEAMFTHETCLDSWALITIGFNFTPNHRNYEYRHEILDAFLMYPDGLEMIRDGLEHLFSSDFSPREREDANVFLDYWKNEAENQEESASQLDLLGQAQELAPQRKRVDGAIVFKRFTKAIQDNGGD